jgi:hypothetical protein
LSSEKKNNPGKREMEMLLLELSGTWGQTIHDNIGIEKSHDTVPFKYIFLVTFIMVSYSAMNI